MRNDKAVVHLSKEQARLIRWRANRLGAPETGLLAAARAVLAVQAQELPAARLALRARGLGFTAADVDKQLQEGGRLVRTWALRGTLHLLAREDAAWLVPVLAPACIAADRRRMEQLGWDAERTARGLKLLQEVLQAQGELPRESLRALLERAGLPHAGQAPVHLLYRAAFEGSLCYGPSRAKKETYVPFESWVGAARPRPRADALAELARRYLQSYAPANANDLAAWSGLSLKESRQALAQLEGQLLPVQVEGEPACLLAEQLGWLDEKPQPGSPQARLLPRFDAYLLGYAGRDLAVEARYARRLHPGGGIIRSSLAVDGRVVGLWASSPKRAGLELSLECFDSLPEGVLEAFRADAEDVGRFLGYPVRLRFDNID